MNPSILAQICINNWEDWIFSFRKAAYLECWKLYIKTSCTPLNFPPGSKPPSEEGDRLIVWCLRCPFFRGMPMEPDGARGNFWSRWARLGYGPEPAHTLKRPYATIVWLVRQSTTKVWPHLMLALCQILHELEINTYTPIWQYNTADFCVKIHTHTCACPKENNIIDLSKNIFWKNQFS